MDIAKILENAKHVGSTELVENDTSKEIMRVAQIVYDNNKDMHPWFRGVDMIEKLKHLGKSNVRSHMEKLGEKNMLESKLHKTHKVYRIRVVQDG